MAKHEEELTLGDIPVEETDPAAGEDRTDPEAMKPEKFDLGEWIGGLSPIRRGVTIYGRQDLRSKIDILEDRVRGLVEGSEKWRATIKQLAEARAAYEASAMEIVVRSIDPDDAKKLFTKIQEAKSDKARAAREIEYTAAHIVEPEGLDAAALKRVHAVLPREVDRITVAATMADHAALSGVTAQFRQ